MNGTLQVRWGWLRFMYGYTIAGAGAFGLAMLFFPATVQSLLGFPAEDPVVFGIVGSTYTAFGLVAILGLRAPLVYVPLLLLQLCYKSVWFLALAVPMLVTGRFPSYAVVLLAIFATYIIGDLIAIPFGLVFTKRERQARAVVL